MNRFNRKQRAFEQMQGGSVDSQVNKRGPSSVEDFSVNRNEGTENKAQKAQAASPTMNKMGAASSAVDTASNGGNAMQTAGSGVSSYAMASGNPYLMAAGLGMNVIGGAQKRERQREKQAIKDEMDRRGRVIDLMGKIGQGFGSIG